MSNVQAQVALVALNQMLKGRHFSISTIDQIGEMLDIPVYQHPNYKTLRPLHCVDWVDIPYDLRKQIPGMLQEILQTEAVQFEAKSEVVDLSIAGSVSILDRVKRRIGL